MNAPPPTTNAKEELIVDWNDPKVLEQYEKEGRLADLVDAHNPTPFSQFSMSASYYAVIKRARRLGQRVCTNDERCRWRRLTML